MVVPLKHRWSISHNYLAGITAGDWLRLLAENRFAVAPAYWHRAAFITMTSVANSLFCRAEEWRYAESIRSVKITRPPLFILGHWRSGTTLLHYLMAQDTAQFSFANTYQVVNPQTFLTTEKAMARYFAKLVPPTRPMDNMAQSFASPQEDEFAPLLISLLSLYLGISFPSRIDYYSKFLTFRDASPAQIDRWKEAFVWFCKKLTFHNDKALLLKSPAHTGRIRLLLEMFPDARFVHIHRDPYRVFQSQRHFFDTAAWFTYLQKPDLEATDRGILTRYRDMYDAFFSDLPQIPEGRFCEVGFSELERNPVSTVRTIYESLGLRGFDSLLPRLHSYVNSLAQYQKNDYPRLDDRTRKLVADHWAPCFERWGYQV